MATFRQRGRENTAKVLLNDFNPSQDHSYFLGIGNAVTSPIASSADTPDTIQADHVVWDNLFFMNQVIRSDVSLMIKKYEWQANKVYVPFSKDKNQYELGEQFYVYNSQNRSVYLCLASPSNEYSESLYPPVGFSTDPEVKQDGYTWKFLYQIGEEDLQKFDYPNYIPIQEIGTDLYTDQRVLQQNVAASAIRGSIEAIDVSVQGNAYAGAVNVNYTNSLYFIAAKGTTEDDLNYVLINQDGRYELALTSGFYDNQYVITFENGYTGTIQSSSIDSDTGFLKLILCNTTGGEPPQSTLFSILPRIEIIGNGSGAIAIPILTEDKLILKIKMVSNGINYSYVDAYVSVQNGTIVKPLIGLNGLASDVTEILGSRHLMISKKIKPTSSLSQDDPVVYSAPENTGIVYDGSAYTNVISPNTFYTQLSLIKSPRKLVNNLEDIAGNEVIEVKLITLEAIDPRITITIGSINSPYLNTANFFEVDDIITRGPANYPDQFRAQILEITNTGFSTTLVCYLINGAFETYSGYRIKNLKNTTETGDDAEFVFQDCDNNCSKNITTVYENTFNNNDFISDNGLIGSTSLGTAEIITPVAGGNAFVNPLYPTKAKIKAKNVSSALIPAHYENGEYVSGEVVSSLRIINGTSTVIKKGSLVSVSDTIQIIGDDSTFGYAYILECTIDRGVGQINTPYELVNSDGISLETNVMIRQGTTGTVGKIVRTAIVPGTDNVNKVYLYVNNYNGAFKVDSVNNLYAIDNLYNPTSYTNMKLKVSDIIYQSPIVRYSGKLLYINDAGPVQRRIENTENLKLLIEF